MSPNAAFQLLLKVIWRNFYDWMARWQNYLAWLDAEVVVWQNSKSSKRNFFFVDVEPPVVDFCESPPIFLVKNEADLARNKAQVEWDPPIFHDNSLGDALNLTLSIEGKNVPSLNSKYILPLGKASQVLYEVTDLAGNVAQCQMEITLQGSTL